MKKLSEKFRPQYLYLLKQTALIKKERISRKLIYKQTSIPYDYAFKNYDSRGGCNWVKCTLREKSIYRHDSEWPLFLLAQQRPLP